MQSGCVCSDVAWLSFLSIPLSISPSLPLPLPPLSHTSLLPQLPLSNPSLSPTPPSPFRPKFILVRVGPRTYSTDSGRGVSTVSAASLLEDVRSAARYLRRKGFMVSEEKEGENLCGEKEVEKEGEKEGEGGKVSASASASATRYRCVWGTRLNEFEFSGKKWGVW